MDHSMSDAFLNLLDQISLEHQRTVAKLQAEIDDLKSRLQSRRPCEALSSQERISEDGPASLHGPCDKEPDRSMNDEAPHSGAVNASHFPLEAQGGDEQNLGRVASVAASVAPSEDDDVEHKGSTALRKAAEIIRFASQALADDEEEEGEEMNSGLRGRVHRLINHDKFELLVVSVILLNTLTMAMEMQYKGMQAGYNISYRGTLEPADEVWPFAEKGFPALENAFTVVFVVELALRIYGTGCRYFCYPLNWVDIVVVLNGVFDVVLQTVASGNSVNNPLLRLLRLVRLLKGVRILTKFLGVLKLLVMSIVATVSTLFYSLCLLGLIQIVTAMFMTQLLSDYINDTSKPDGERAEIYRYWGTFTYSFLTIFEITLANWVPPCRALVTYVGEGYAIFFYVYRCTVGFAILSVISAVFIQKTLKQAQKGEEEMIKLKQQEAEEQHKKLVSLFKYLDTSGDGSLGWDEFSSALEQPRTICWLKALEINVDDLGVLFKMLDGGDGSIDIDEFTTAMARVKGPARSLDLLQVLTVTKEVQQRVDRLTSELETTRRPTLQAPVRSKSRQNSQLSNCPAKEVVQETKGRIQPAETSTPVHPGQRQQESESGAWPMEETTKALSKASV